MTKAQTTEELPSWMEEERDRSIKQKEKGTTVNNTVAPPVKRPAISVEPTKKVDKKVTIERITKGFQLSKAKAFAWDSALPLLKHELGKTGPELADEMVDLLLKKYSNHLKL